MTTHVLHFTSETEISVRWTCGVCQRFIDFPRPGHGEPSATQFEFPENVDAYLDPCQGQYVGIERNITRTEFLGRFATEELGSLDLSQDARIVGMMFRIRNSDPINMNDPRWLDDLSYAEGVSLLPSGRTQIILQ